jgi:D-aminopeptidase
MKRLIVILIAVLFMTPSTERPRARDVGITVGVLPTGPLNAITDVQGVLVGHTTWWDRPDL